MSFLFTTLLGIGLPIIAVPVLIHLIHLRRHRRIRWAAMEFLLQSQKRHKKWILLKQLLLLFLRMTALAMVAVMLAQPVLRSEWGAILGGATTHHVVLLDDSYSMTDRIEETSAFERAQHVVQRIAERAHGEGGAQRLTLLRFSEAAGLSAGSQPDIFRAPLDAALNRNLESLLARTGASATAVGPIAALEALTRLPQAAEDETWIVYLVSDFRAREWNRAQELRRHMLELQTRGGQWHLVNCTDTTHANRAIVALQPQAGLHAAGVEMWMELRVANYADTAARGVTVQLVEDGFPRGAIQLDPIPARGERTHRFRINFPVAGPHAIEAILPPDAVAIDNHRFYAAEVPDEIPVLLIDGSATGEDSRFISTSLAPGGPVKTGWRPRIEPPSYLRHTDQLDQYAALFLLDLPRLDRPEIEALETYARSGGGVVYFLGERTDRDQVNGPWYRDGAGLFPVPIRLPTQLLGPDSETSPDLVVSDHPIFRIFAGQRNSFLQRMLVDFYYTIDSDWPASETSGRAASAPDTAATRILARLRNRAPIVVEKTFGAGRGIVFLTKASPERTAVGPWNNWGNNPAYPVVMNELASYLSMSWRGEPARIVGDPIAVVLDESQYTSDLKFTLPTVDGTEVLPVDAIPVEDSLQARLETTPHSGIYRVELTRHDQRPETRLFAINVPNGEGDLARMTQNEIESRLEGVRLTYHLAADFTKQLPDLAGYRLSDAVLYGLIALLLLEQLLAYWFSYHPKSMGPTS